MSQANHPLSISTAAAEILALINSRPHSPFPHELEEIIARVEGEPVIYECAACRDRALAGAPENDRLKLWRQREAEFVAKLKATKDDDCDALIDVFGDYCRGLWETPVRDWSDVVMRLEIARHWNAPVGKDERIYPYCILDEGSGDRAMDEHALAHLAAAVDQLSRPPHLTWAGHDEALAVDRAAWRRLVTEVETALRTADVTPADPVLDAAQDAAFAKLNAFERAIWARPARTIGDVQFLAELFTYQLWPASGSTEVFPNNDPKTLEELIEDGPFCMGETVDAACAALLKAIRDVLSPSDPLSQNDAALVRDVRTAIANHFKAQCACAEESMQDEALNAHEEACERALGAAIDQIPNPPRSPLHVLLRAEFAWHRSSLTFDGSTIQELTEGNSFEKPAAQLIEAVLAYFGGIRP